jgi:hypothetical protein
VAWARAISSQLRSLRRGCLVGTIASAVALALLTWGLFAMDVVPSLRHGVVSLAGPDGALASLLPASVANVGIALGSSRTVDATSRLP